MCPTSPHASKRDNSALCSDTAVAIKALQGDQAVPATLWVIMLASPAVCGVGSLHSPACLHKDSQTDARSLDEEQASGLASRAGDSMGGP